MNLDHVFMDFADSTTYTRTRISKDNLAKKNIIQFERLLEFFLTALGLDDSGRHGLRQKEPFCEVEWLTAWIDSSGTKNRGKPLNNWAGHINTNKIIHSSFIIL